MPFVLGMVLPTLQLGHLAYRKSLHKQACSC